MELVAARYMTGFRCLGGDCEDTCCQYWSIAIDESHYRALHERLTAPEERAALAAAVRRTEDRNPNRYALMVLRDDNRACHFLGPDGLCAIHARHGEAVLPDACSMFPRLIQRAGERIELVGSLSCPEAARLALLTDDGLDVVPSERAPFGRGVISHAIDEGGFVAVRHRLVGLLRERRFPIASRLFFLAQLADRARGGPLPDADLDALHRQYQDLEVEGPFPMMVVRALLRVPAELMFPSMRVMVEELEAFYAARGAPIGGDVGALQDAYRALPPLPPDVAARLDAVIERYAVHRLLRDWYVKEPTFIGYVHATLALVALLRFVIASLARMAAADAFDRVAVRAVYLVSRMIEHNSELVRRLVRGLEEQGMGLEHAVSLVRM